MKKPLIYLITEGTLTAENFYRQASVVIDAIEIAVENEISLIQVREKSLTAKLLFKLASEAAKLTRNSVTKLLINDRADIALAANADGVHLTKNSVAAKLIRSNFPEEFVIGVSAHSIEAAQKAQTQGADFVTFSPVFTSPGKGEPQGLSKLEEICRTLEPFPVIALGGIDETNYLSVLQNGASGFAAIRFLNDVRNLAKLREIKGAY